MPESAHPNRWFGANPQATASQGKNPHGWTRDTPTTWQSALGLSESKDREPPEGGGHWYPEPPKRRGPMIAALVILAVVAIAVGWIIGNATSSSSSSADLSAKVDPTTAQGAHYFVSFACAACHGTAGEGVWATNAPRLAGMSDWYLARQLHNFQQGVRGAHARDFPGTQMAQLSSALRDERAVSDLLTYVGTLR